MTAEEVRTRIDVDGYVILPEILDPAFVARARRELAHAIEVDTHGTTIVARLPREQAEKKRDEVMRYGGDPRLRTSLSMIASVEPCDD